MRLRLGVVVATAVVTALVVGLVAVLARTHDGADVGSPWSAGRGWGPMMGGDRADEWRGDEAGYLAEMVEHHRDGISAARVVAEESDRPALRALAATMVAVQQRQVTRMERWLRAWYPDVRTTGDDHLSWMGDLSGLRGDRLDRAFLRRMIGHHLVAVMMSQHLLAAGVEHEQVATLARHVRDVQRAEIRTMRRWLVRWFGVDGSTGWGSMGPMGPMMRGAGW